jgi:hypothetical protein
MAIPPWGIALLARVPHLLQPHQAALPRKSHDDELLFFEHRSFLLLSS